MACIPPPIHAYNVRIPAVWVVAVDLPVAIIVDAIETKLVSLQIACPPPILA